MAKSDTVIRIALFGYPGCSAWISAGLLEFFAIANIASRMRQVTVRFDCRVIGVRGGPIEASQGVVLRAVRASGRYAALIVPPVWAQSREEFTRRLAETAHVVPALQRAAGRASIVASSCSGAALLAEAGLLKGYRATTCWWLAQWFEKQYPGIALDAAKLLVVDRKRWTAAAGTAYVHLCLELVKRFAGEQVAGAAGRLALVEPRRGSQSPFLAHADHAVAAATSSPANRAALLMQRRPEASISIDALARQVGTTARTLNRQFDQLFGVTPLAYRQSQRIALARRLLESGETSIERIVGRCGYSDAASFRKLFTREVGMSPREYRSRFGC